MMRLLLDTCVIIEWLTDPDSIGDEVWDIINDPRCKLYVSAETARELIVSFNNKKLPCCAVEICQCRGPVPARLPDRANVVRNNSKCMCPLRGHRAGTGPAPTPGNRTGRKLLPKYWKTAEEMLLAMKDEALVDILPISESTMFTYSRLQLNEAQNHKDPSDHVIIAHAITERLTLLSSDGKSPFYRNQGLELIEY